MFVVSLKPRRIEKLMKRVSFDSVHLKARVEELQELIGDIRVGKRELAGDDMRLGPEGISSENAEVERDADGPGGGRFGLVVALKDPLGRHALESALELAEHFAAQS